MNNLRITVCIFAGLVTSFTTSVWSQDLHFTNPQKIIGSSQPLYGVVDAKMTDSSLVILTQSFPSLHIFQGKDFENYHSFGRKGNGPMELGAPNSIEVIRDRIFVLDARPTDCKIVEYSVDGSYISSRKIRGYQICYSFKVISREDSYFYVLEVGEIFKSDRTIVMLKNKDLSEVLTKLEFNNIFDFQISGGPMSIMEVENPFLPAPVWCIIGDEFVFWDGKSDKLTGVNLYDANKNYSIEISKNQEKISKEDFSNYLDRRYTSDKPIFGYQNFYENVRKTAKEKLSVPEKYPLLTKIISESDQNMWIKRTIYRGGGDIWSFYPSLNTKKELRLEVPKSKKLIVLNEAFFAFLSKDGSSNEIIEIHNIEL